jgi:hypothetical protein
VPVSQSANVAEPSSSVNRRREILTAIFRVLDNANVRYCIPHGHEGLPADVQSDIDLIVEEAALPNRLAALLEANADRIGAQVIQWLDNRAHLIVLADTRHPGPPQLLQLHVAPDCEKANRIFYAGRDILDSQFSCNGIPVPAAEIEFGCILCNCIVRGQLVDDRAARLCALYDRAPLSCEQQTAHLFGATGAIMICLAAESGDWSAVRNELPQLRRRLLSAAANQPGVNRRRIGMWIRRIKRWAHPPCGFQVAFLSPNGVDRSIVIAGVHQTLSPAFLKTEQHTFAPSILSSRPKTDSGTDAIPTRGMLALLSEAPWWLVCGTLGYLLSIYPALARSALVLNHRCLLDAMVVPKRYRYSGSRILLKWIARISPKADLVVLLNAPAEVIQSRSQDMALGEAVRQCREYRNAVEPLPNGRIIDASGSVQDTIAAVNRIILQSLRDRIVRRFRFSA